MPACIRMLPRWLHDVENRGTNTVCTSYRRDDMGTAEEADPGYCEISKRWETVSRRRLAALMLMATKGEGVATNECVCSVGCSGEDVFCNMCSMWGCVGV